MTRVALALALGVLMTATASWPSEPVVRVILGFDTEDEGFRAPRIVQQAKLRAWSIEPAEAR